MRNQQFIHRLLRESLDCLGCIEGQLDVLAEPTTSPEYKALQIVRGSLINAASRLQRALGVVPDWRPMAELAESGHSDVLVYTSHENILWAAMYDGELTYLTALDGVNFATEVYGEPQGWQPLPIPPNKF